MRDRKKVLLPVGMLSPVGDELLCEHADLIYCVDDEQLSAIRANPLAVMLGEHTPRVDARTLAAQQRFEDNLPHVHGVYAWGLNAEIEIDANMLERAPRLEVIGVVGSGADHIDLQAASERGVLVVNAAGAGNHIVAEHVVGLMLALTRGIALADRLLHEQKRYHAKGVLRPEGFGLLRGKTLGIVGFGFVGRDLAQMCRTAFNMSVVAYDPFFDPVEAARQGVTLLDSVEELCAVSDFVSVHVPLSERTRTLIGESELGAMKATAYLINSSRGPTVDADALLRALREHRIAGAGLDVFDPEPLPDGHPLFDLDNVVLTPHTGGSSHELPELLSAATAREMVRALQGARPWHVVNRDVLSRDVAPAGATLP
jgi:phosphoglycerate dehydrogenase-like enzyme